ncbi:hypothetical protein [Paraburkholderia tagetis]|uniref:Uncharacterized protein n=1 Tax=Paraburkholderia tagetis TaxID=2913261 RepID=A0A9X1RNG2_9BURK|nr:hypothetical protein [Paraburkholderia tagetis]
MSTNRKRARLDGQLGCFVQQYARKARPGELDPDDRKSDHKIAKAMRRLLPDELSEMLSGDDANTNAESPD